MFQSFCRRFVFKVLGFLERGEREVGRGAEKEEEEEFDRECGGHRVCPSPLGRKECVVEVVRDCCCTVTR